ncbi:uncharacterized protein I206_101171 [Kwoniella pini CBS 10737]|uniref:Glucosidase 2 subunit beta n=1 Tax=Kwoniella pini CBS 10737 TaxID=1296096 RepID=A0A1B9IBB2_9TREE|nr:protein kinase C substrate 80K-H [Kwoniella pini CBS 10737]OCF52856.1 protein kinase C substrate 80K-H [Kwoniella pini CBS 10737]
MSLIALIPILALLALSSRVLAEKKIITPDSIRGLDPALYNKYEPNSSNTFQCLDGSKVIPYSAINDDYCDCPDGSDEPGTSACPNTYFYCKNEGHIPGKVLSSRVNDGICDPECCDGSDEWFTGVCFSQCSEIGKKYRAEEEIIRKTRKTGSKIRGTYIKWAQGEKNRIEADLEAKKKEVVEKEKEVERARIALEKTESSSKEELEKKKKSPIYKSLLDHRLTLTRLRSKTQRLENELNSLRSILEELAKGYNPNYQDMAVKAAVVGYEELSGISPTPGEESEGDVKEEPKEEEIKEWELDDLQRKDLEALLWEHSPADEEDGDEDEESGLLWKIDEYIPDSLYDSWETLRDLTIEWLIKLGLSGKSKIVKGSAAEGPHVAAAREKHRNLGNELKKLNDAITDSEDTLQRMNTEFGPQAEWKKLDGTCVDKVSGDYTYEICFFGKTKQKSNKDGSSNYMGTFAEWNTAATPGTYDYYTKQLYNNGGRCWNGPLRSVQVDLSCGKENALLSISEPEKCEYQFRVTTPALCWPEGEGEESDVKVEEDVKAEAIKEEL